MKKFEKNTIAIAFIAIAALSTIGLGGYGGAMLPFAHAQETTEEDNDNNQSNEVEQENDQEQNIDQEQNADNDVEQTLDQSEHNSQTVTVRSGDNDADVDQDNEGSESEADAESADEGTSGAESGDAKTGDQSNTATVDQDSSIEDIAVSNDVEFGDDVGVQVADNDVDQDQTATNTASNVQVAIPINVQACLADATDEEGGAGLEVIAAINACFDSDNFNDEEEEAGPI